MSCAHSQLQQKKVGCCPHCQETIVAPIIQRVPCAAARAEERRVRSQAQTESEELPAPAYDHGAAAGAATGSTWS